MFITIALIPAFKGIAVRLKAVDIPDERKVHQIPMPKSGGVCMALGIFAPIFFWSSMNNFVKSVFIGAGIIVVFGFIDDIKNLGYKEKFAGQIAAALMVILCGGVKIKCLGMLLPEDVILPDIISIPLTCFVIVGITNAINLSDGLDGLAGGVSLLSFVCIGYLAYRVDNIEIALFSFAAVGAIFGFLRFNTYPANIFMGDSGSQLLGFFVVVLSISLTQQNTPLSPVLPLLVIGFPVLDTFAVMAERLSTGRPVFTADKNHFHHKLLRIGLYHNEAVIFIYFLQAFLITTAFVFRFYTEWFLIILYLTFSGIILTSFFITDKTGWKLKRHYIFGGIIESKLKKFNEKGIIVKISFKILSICTPLLLFFTCLLPADIPGYFAFISIGLAGLNVVILFTKNKLLSGTLRLALYLLIPFAVYLSEVEMVFWMTSKTRFLYNLFFGFLIFFAVLTLKFTRRKKGFKSTPLDFLIVFIALIVPNLPGTQISIYHMGFLAVKIIALLFSYEVLIGEWRGNVDRLCFSTVAALILVTVRCVV